VARIAWRAVVDLTAEIDDLHDGGLWGMAALAAGGLNAGGFSPPAQAAGCKVSILDGPAAEGHTSISNRISPSNGRKATT